MEIKLTATIPDEIAATLQNGSSAPIGRIFLEMAAIQAYQAGLITSREVQEMLGFESREELFEFFKRYDVRSKYTVEDLERDKATLATLLDKQ